MFIEAFEIVHVEEASNNMYKAHGRAYIDLYVTQQLYIHQANNNQSTHVATTIISIETYGHTIDILNAVMTGTITIQAKEGTFITGEQLPRRFLYKEQSSGQRVPQFERSEVQGQVVELSFSGGQAPVRAKGWVNTLPFSFYARRDGWAFAIAINPLRNPDGITQNSNEGYYVEGSYGSANGYEASYMPEEVARKIIINCIGAFINGQENKNTEK